MQHSLEQKPSAHHQVDIHLMGNLLVDVQSNTTLDISHLQEVQNSLETSGMNEEDVFNSLWGYIYSQIIDSFQVHPQLASELTESVVQMMQYEKQKHLQEQKRLENQRAAYQKSRLRIYISYVEYAWLLRIRPAELKQCEAGTLPIRHVLLSLRQDKEIRYVAGGTHAGLYPTQQ